MEDTKKNEIVLLEIKIWNRDLLNELNSRLDIEAKRSMIEK